MREGSIPAIDNAVAIALATTSLSMTRLWRSRLGFNHPSSAR
ncbi:MAG: hypothetical protein ABR592_08540 [Nitriliruptorales bacterium]